MQRKPVLVWKKKKKESVVKCSERVVMLPSCCLWLNFRHWTERTDMPDKEVGSREAKHNLLVHSQEEGNGNRGRTKNTEETEDVRFFLLVELDEIICTCT